MNPVRSDDDHETDFLTVADFPVIERGWTGALAETPDPSRRAARRGEKMTNDVTKSNARRFVTDALPGALDGWKPCEHEECVYCTEVIRVRKELGK